jgi:hypothetical protein
MNTLYLARKYGAGTLLKNCRGETFRVSDWSPASGDVYGHPINLRGVAGDYQRLPADGLSLGDEPDLGDVPRGGMS